MNFALECICYVLRWPSFIAADRWHFMKKSALPTNNIYKITQHYIHSFAVAIEKQPKKNGTQKKG